MIRILYLVHNLNDAAVARRVRMLRAGGAEVSVAGFWRGGSAPAEIAGAPAAALGQSRDARLWQRAMLVARSLMRRDVRTAAGVADVVIARNLEMLLLAVRLLGPGQRLVYECLDIHRIMLGRGPASMALRALERLLLRSARLLLTSSPAFNREYFQATQRLTIPVRLVENKLLALDSRELPGAGRRTPGPPWTIGWFGNLRCRRSLDELKLLAGQLEGRARVLVAGRASPAEFPEFEQAVAAPHVEYVGPYTASELPGLYARCHFAWCIDYFEEGLNSEWLLPNRLYESIACGAVPLARAGTETSRWLERHVAGLVLSRESGVQELQERLAAMGAADFESLQGQVHAIGSDAVIAGKAECEQLVRIVSP